MVSNIQPRAGSTSRPRRGRGISTGSELERNVNNHGLLNVEFNQEYGKAVGRNANSLSKQIGVLVRGSFPLTLNKWKEVTPELKNLVKQRLLVCLKTHSSYFRHYFVVLIYTFVLHSHTSTWTSVILGSTSI